MIYASSNLLKHEFLTQSDASMLGCSAASKVPNSDSTGGQSLWSSNPSCASVEIWLVPIRRRDGQNWAEDSKNTKIILGHIGVDWWSTSPNGPAKKTAGGLIRPVQFHSLSRRSIFLQGVEVFPRTLGTEMRILGDVMLCWRWRSEES